MPRVSRDFIVMSSPQNPVASFLGDWIDSDFMKDLFLTCPKAAIQMRVGVPEEVQLEIVDVVENLVFFKASIPKIPLSEFDRHGRRVLDRRLKKCPIMNISENEMISAEQSIALLTGLGIKVPDDIDVIEDDALDGYIHYICKITL